MSTAMSRSRARAGPVQASAEPAAPALLIQPAPHVHAPEPSAAGLLRQALLAALVPAGAAVAVWGLDAARVLGATALAAGLTEMACERARGRALQETAITGAALSGILLALTLPASIPTWMAVLGAVVAIALGKHVFGGLGHNLFNPALIGHVFLLSSFAAAVSAGATDAPPVLALAREGAVVPDYVPLLWHAGPGPLAAASPLAVYAAAALVLGWRLGRWETAGGFFLGSAAVAFVVGWSPVYHWVAGLAPLTVAFFLNDPVTTPVAGGGRFLFGAGVGALLVVLRTSGSYLEGAAFAVLVMNALTPLLNRLSVWQRRRRRQRIQEARPLKVATGAEWVRDLRSALVLVLVSSAAGVLLATFHHATAPLIASQQQEREVEVGLKGVMPQAASFEKVADVNGIPVYEARDAQGQRVGMAAFAEGDGYHGVIRLAVGVDVENDRVTGVRVLKQSETAGLGARIEERWFLSQFEGKSIGDAFMPGEDIQGVSGATVSSMAVAD
ncbi:MAG: RnfABCDGE type electron transport complex subunit D, partial [Bacillota bacterium]